MVTRTLCGVLACAVAIAFDIVGAAATGPAGVEAILTDANHRREYLARAIIWRDPGPLSPADLLHGPKGVFSPELEQAADAAAIDCAFVEPGQALGGNTPKFLCRAADDRNLRIKYWDPEQGTGNREVFTIVAASRLMWALGFEAIPALPIHVRCIGCPKNPMTGEGATGTRRYAAMLEPAWPTPVILSNSNVDQGWSWQELDAAIQALPPGPERTRQRTHFDALALLGVLIQHGDRGPSQQRLYCDAPIITTAGELRSQDGKNQPSTLVERPDASACPQAAVVIVDAGATFGGAGRTSNERTAKMNLTEWRSKPIFSEIRANECRGRLKISLTAGHGGESNPVISEQGRSFLAERLRHLTTDHVRAIFRAARVDELATLPSDGTLDEWVSVFQDKVSQIETQRCQPAP